MHSARQVFVVELVAGQHLDELGTLGHQSLHRSPVDRTPHYVDDVGGIARWTTGRGERRATAALAAASSPAA
jgi:hypothetical protein